ncbi:MAG TPA: hypothetical protein VF432_03715 [Thermoanaerobaculia bacterium]
MSIRKVALSLFIVAALGMSAATPQKIERDGVAVELMSSQAVAGKEVDLAFRIRGADGTPLDGVRPAAWIDARDPKAEATACRDKIESFLSGTLRARPQVDLNAYYVVTLNAEPSIAVIDPLIGFGGSKLLTAVNLPSPGVDWALSRDQKRLFVSMPLVNRVAVIDTESWRIAKEVNVGQRPSRVALHRDTLWVASDATVDAIDTRTLDVVASIPAGKGAHHLAFSDEHAFISGGGTIAIVDAMNYARVTEVPVGKAIDGLAFSTLGSVLYAIDGTEGVVSVVDPRQRKITARIIAQPGLNSIQFAPGGRWGFVTNGKENAVHVLDSSTAALITTAHDVGARPDQIAFTEEFAYVRAAGADQVKMIRLADLRPGAEPSLATFPGGQIPPAAARAESFAAAIVPAPEPKAVLVANPADKLVYFYSEGMAAPMGNFSAFKRSPMAALIVDRSLRESQPSVFSIRTKVAEAGTYDVAFFLNDPRVVHCFELTVQADPGAPPKSAERAVVIEPILEQTPVRAGGQVEVKFRLTDASTREPHRNLRDVRALAFLAPGTEQYRIAAQPDGEGIYRVTVPVPESGIYYVFLESPALKLKVNKTRPLIFEVLEREKP